MEAAEQLQRIHGETREALFVHMKSAASRLRAFTYWAVTVCKKTLEEVFIFLPIKEEITSSHLLLGASRFCSHLLSSSRVLHSYFLCKWSTCQSFNNTATSWAQKIFNGKLSNLCQWAVYIPDEIFLCYCELLVGLPLRFSGSPSLNHTVDFFFKCLWLLWVWFCANWLVRPMTGFTQKKTWPSSFNLLKLCDLKGSAAPPNYLEWKKVKIVCVLISILERCHIYLESYTSN